MTFLSGLRQGDVFLLGLRVADRSIAGLQCTIYTTDKFGFGNLLIAPDGTMTGSLSAAPTAIPVTTLDRSFQIGDVVVNDTTNETLVVRAIWLTNEGWRWSSSPNRNGIYDTHNWTVVGSATLN